MRFEAVILAVGFAGTAVLATTGALGYRGVGGIEGLELHLMLAVGTAAAVLFAHVWVLVFLLAIGRGLRRAPAARTADPGGLARVHRLAMAAIGLAVAALVALLLSGANAYTRAGTGAGLHGSLFWVALALQAAALAAEWRALGAGTALIAALDR